MLFQKMRPLALAFMLMLLFGTLALAQPNNPPDNRPAPDAGDQTGTMLGGLGVLGCVCVFGLIFLAINIAILMWVYKDAKARGAEPMLWLILVFFTGLVGLIIWLIVRPPLQEPRI